MAAGDSDKSEEAPASRIPLTVLTGALGAGKTTLLKHILEKPHGYRVAVIQNEFSEEMGIEAPLFTDAKGETIKDVYELPNGCLCCSAKDGLVGMLDVLLEQKDRFDYVLVEATGVADPESICEIFWVDEGLGSRIYLDGVVALVDSRNALAALGHMAHMAEKAKFCGGYGGMKPSAHKADAQAQGLGLEAESAKQVACADVLILNKTDLTSQKERQRLTAVLKGMNPAARLLESSYAVVPLQDILGLKAFDRNRLAASVAALGNLREGYGHSHEHGPDANCALCQQQEEGKLVAGHGIESVLLRGEEDILYDPDRIRSWLADVLWEGSAGFVYRCKGLFRGLSEDDDDADMTDEAPSKPVAYAMQGVGRLFDIDEVPEVAVTVSKFLFIGRSLKQDILAQGLRECRTSDESEGE
eukprot:TRINITY_DN110859_c0_g1_i1.p1 TRINITY_DN110859_c0_g1~~TRINITY_DN110859_c0_g1_i1.p1  ORF type:complete len:415 (+),score=114.47 TRINITY_DN110859_c0_g1_i1:28-1272(+)